MVELVHMIGWVLFLERTCLALSTLRKVTSSLLTIDKYQSILYMIMEQEMDQLVDQSVLMKSLEIKLILEKSLHLKMLERFSKTRLMSSHVILLLIF